MAASSSVALSEHFADAVPETTDVLSIYPSSGYDDDESDTATQPRRQPSMLREELLAQGVPAREASRFAVRATLRTALEVTFSRCGYIWIYSACVLLFGLLGLVLWSWDVYQDHLSDHCDQPLSLMLRLFYCIICFYGLKKYIFLCCLGYDPERDPVEPVRIRVFTRLLYLATLVWPVVATVMLFNTKNCSADLKNVVETITAYYAVVAVVIIALPACTASVMLCLIRHGYIREHRDGAPENFIDELPTIEYEASQFNDEAGCYARLCPICLEDFDTARPIKRTLCTENGHVFHRQCLDGWLQFSCLCPLCRTDLTQNSA